MTWQETRDTNSIEEKRMEASLDKRARSMGSVTGAHCTVCVDMFQKIVRNDCHHKDDQYIIATN